MSHPLLSISGLKVFFHTSDGILKAVNGVDLDIPTGKIVGLVGESGGGKSMVGLSIFRLIPEGGRIEAGKVVFDGKDILELTTNEMRSIRGSDISMILQDPLSSLNPAFRIESQIIDVLKLHKGYELKESRIIALEMLYNIGIPEPEKNIRKFPHQLSGGMRQRVVIAIAFICNPKLIIADEPTTALDVTIQAQILKLLKNLSIEYQTSVLFITHDLGIVANLCDSVAVIYAGEIIEMAMTKELFAKPMHPYTSALFRSIPRHDKKVEHFYTIKGTMLNPIDQHEGCNFYSRCEERLPICLQEIDIQSIHATPHHTVRCLKYK